MTHVSQQVRLAFKYEMLSLQPQIESYNNFDNTDRVFRSVLY